MTFKRLRRFAAQHNASAVVCIHNGTAEVWVQVWRKLFVMLAVEKGVLSEDSIAGKTVYIVDGLKVILNDY